MYSGTPGTATADGTTKLRSQNHISLMVKRSSEESMAPLLATPSEHKTVAAVLANRGFVWKYAKVEDVQSNSHNVSFEDEWHQFASKVSDIADAVTNVKPRNADDVWNNHFKNVITNAGSGYRTKASFSSALFEALRDSLNGFVCPIANCKDGSSNNLIVLHSTSMNVGFGKEVHRTKLGFDDKYGLSTNCIPDHGCFVFGTMKKQSSSGMDAINEFYDMTAVVELKLENSSCESFAFDEDEGTIEEPSFVNAHGPTGQAIICSMDVWHCLARRGVSVPSVPVVVLAGKSKLDASRSTKTRSKCPKLEMLVNDEYESNGSGRLCCVEACIYIPEYCGKVFMYSVNHIVSFNGTTGLASDDMLSESMAAVLQNTRDKRAMAIYIRTMRIGLEHALQVSKHRNMSHPVSPVSLCCRRLLTVKNQTDIQLVASPIPLEDYPGRPGISINQGELFEILEPTIAFFAGISPICWFADAEREDARWTSKCLVKVSCVSVHNTYIRHDKCKDALTVLYGACMNNTTLRKELAKVLLGFCYDSSLVIIMKDLRRDGFMILDHQKMRNDNKLPDLWLAFCGLVKSLLLPMANASVVHMDIRSTSTITYNILYRNTSESGTELHLVDFDSLIHFESACDDTITKQNGAVHWKKVLRNAVAGVELESAYRYLFWQVLWIAYTWRPRVASATKDALPKKPNASNFVSLLFIKDNFFVDFKKWLGPVRVEALKKLWSNEMSPATVEQALDVLGNPFYGSSQKG